jgi:hypothetical protein
MENNNNKQLEKVLTDYNNNKEINEIMRSRTELTSYQIEELKQYYSGLIPILENLIDKHTNEENKRQYRTTLNNAEATLTALNSKKEGGKRYRKSRKSRKSKKNRKSRRSRK